MLTQLLCTPCSFASCCSIPLPVSVCESCLVRASRSFVPCSLLRAWVAHVSACVVVQHQKSQCRPLVQATSQHSPRNKQPCAADVLNSFWVFILRSCTLAYSRQHIAHQKAGRVLCIGQLGSQVWQCLQDLDWSHAYVGHLRPRNWKASPQPSSLF